MFKKMNLFSKTSMKVLFFLLERPSAKLYEREMARKTGASIGAVNGILKLLVKEKMLMKEKKGRLYFYEVNMRNPIGRQVKVLINVMKLEDLVDEISPVAATVTLFGSCAEGTNTQDSDIDLFVLSRDKSRISEAIRRFQRKIGIEIQAIIIEPRELADFRKGNEHIYEQIDSGIRLWDANEL
jgi:predicted nucleotidyltransferase